MNQRRLFVVVVTAAALIVGFAAPASADPTGLSVTVQTGVLQITVPSTTANLGTKVNTVPGSVISGLLGQVQVNDARSAAAGSGWVMSAISTALTPVSGPTIPASAIGYVAGTITQSGTATYVANDPTALTGASAVLTATGITGDNSASWNPTVNVMVAGGTLAGVYTGTITHSVA